jgi:hypothetical protein
MIRGREMDHFPIDTDLAGRMRRVVVKRITLTSPDMRKTVPLDVVEMSEQNFKMCNGKQSDLKIVTSKGTSRPDHELNRVAAIGNMRPQ